MIKKTAAMVIDDEPCSAVSFPLRKRVSFSTEVSGLYVSATEYPSDFFYTRTDLKRFRREALDETKEKIRKHISSEEEDTGSATECDPFTQIERAFNIVTSSAISELVLIPILIVGLVAATMACLPVLLLLRVSSILLLPFTSFSSSSSCHGDDDVDSSIQPYSPPTSSESVEAITERLFNFMGYPSLPYCPSSSSDGTPSNYVDNMIHANRL